MTEGEARRGTRDNGLRCGNYAAVADLDPRVIDELLTVLRDAGIAAYAAPTPADMGSYMEARLPARPVDRLWVDDRQVEQARALIEAEDDSVPEPGADAAWQQVLASLQSTSSEPVPPWPVSEDVDGPYDADQHVIRAASVDVDDDEEGGFDEDEHFLPPPPPPLPRLHNKTLAALASIALGLLILATDFDGGSFRVVAVIAVLGGLVSLVWRMRKGPPTDSGWDDGAVL